MKIAFQGIQQPAGSPNSPTKLVLFDLKLQILHFVGLCTNFGPIVEEAVVLMLPAATSKLGLDTASLRSVSQCEP